MPLLSPNRKPLVTIHELELLHAGLGVLIAHYVTANDPAATRYLALRISRQLRLIAEHAELPDRALRPLYRTMAARWQVRALSELPHRKRFVREQ